MEYKGISIKRIAVGVQSQHNAPAEYWFPRQGQAELPDSKELAEMLRYAEQKLDGRPTDVCVAIVYEAPHVIGKQLNRRTPHRIDQREKLETLMHQVLEDCVRDAEAEASKAEGSA